jgi:hypothetical protein
VKTLQIEAHQMNNDEILRAAGIKRIHSEWFTVNYNGISLDCSTVISAKRNPKGEIQYY